MSDTTFVKTIWRAIRASVKWAARIILLVPIAVLAGLVTLLTRLHNELVAWGTPDPVTPTAPVPAPSPAPAA